MKTEYSQNIYLYIKDYVSPQQALVLMKEMEDLPDSAYTPLLSLKLKKPLTSLILSIFLGFLGVDRFFIDDVGMGIGKLICWICSEFFTMMLFSFLDELFILLPVVLLVSPIWQIVDMCLISKDTREKNFIDIKNFLNYYKNTKPY